MNERGQAGGEGKPSWRQRLEFGVVWLLIRTLGALPRAWALQVGYLLSYAVRWALPRLRATGLKNLELAFPERTEAWREETLAQAYGSLGRQLAEFCRMGRLGRVEAERLIEYDGLEHYLAARARGRGVLVLTAHLGAWELSSFFHSLVGYPMGLLIRRLDNPLVDRFVNQIRCLHGNRVLHKDDFARGIITAMRRGETVGILMDTNMTPPQGVFVPFFGVPACTGSGMARIAMKTQAAVLPGFLLWDEGAGRYRLRFGPELALIRTGDAEADATANTAAFTAVLEHYIRENPGQWLWMHRRWKTRPVGEQGIYG